MNDQIQRLVDEIVAKRPRNRRRRPTRRKPNIAILLDCIEEKQQSKRKIP